MLPAKLQSFAEVVNGLSRWQAVARSAPAELRLKIATDANGQR